MFLRGEDLRVCPFGALDPSYKQLLNREHRGFSNPVTSTGSDPLTCPDRPSLRSFERDRSRSMINPKYPVLRGQF